VLFAVDDRVGNFRIFDAIGGIEHPEFETGGEKPAHGGVDLFFGDDAFRHGFLEMGEGGGAFEIAAGFDGEGAGLLRGGDDLMMLVDIVDGAAVRDDIAPEAPFVPKDGGEEAAVAAAGLAVEPVVGAHH